MNKILKWTLISFAIGITGFVMLSIYVFSIFDFGEGDLYLKQDLIDNYNSKQASIYELKDYYNKLVPDGKIIEIEFENDKEIARLAVTNLNSESQDYVDQYFCDWNLDIDSDKVDSVISVMGWTKSTLTEIKLRLDKANCISVTNGEPTNIGFQRSGMGMYFYDLFSKPISDRLKSEYNNSCTHIIYKDKVVLEYGGGAIGPQCFPEK